MKKLIALTVFATASLGANAAPVNNGLQLNGISLNGISLNGISVNGISLNGISLNGFTLNGLNFNALTTNGLATNGVRLNGNLSGVPAQPGATSAGNPLVGLAAQPLTK